MADTIGLFIRRMREGFSSDVETIQAGVIDGRLPPPARTALAAALVYLVEPIDLTPDHIEGIGMIDDAAILRLAAKAAVDHGADDEALRRLAAEAEDLALIFGELVVPLNAFFDRLQKAPDRRGRTPDEVIADPDARMAMWRDVNKRREEPMPIEASKLETSELLKTLRLTVRSHLAQIGIRV